MRAEMRRWIVCAVGLVAIAVGCTATPLPEPPNLDRVRFDDAAGGIGVTGEDEAAPPSSTVFLANLDSDAPSVQVMADEAGAFSASLPGSLGDVVQIQVRPADGPRVPPVDVDSGSGDPVGDGFETCLSGDAPVDFGAVQIDSLPVMRTVTLRNDCAEPVVVLASIRVPSTFNLVAGAELTIAPGGTGDVELSFVAGAEGPVDNHLLLEVTSPTAARRAVLLEAEGTF